MESRRSPQTFVEGFAEWIEELGRRVDSLELNVAGHERQISTVEQQLSGEDCMGDQITMLWKAVKARRTTREAKLENAIREHRTETLARLGTRSLPAEEDNDLWAVLND